MAVSDRRGRKINEIISGVKIIKFTAWEKIMNGLTRSYRTEEGGWILKAFTLYNFSHAISSMIPTVLGIVIFTLYDKFEDGKLSVAQIYELVTLFNATLTPIRYYIMAIMG
jgi:ATP-binding cassette subfamily C (CFTR/MRP) protein 2